MIQRCNQKAGNLYGLKHSPLGIAELGSQLGVPQAILFAAGGIPVIHQLLLGVLQKRPHLFPAFPCDLRDVVPAQAPIGIEKVNGSPLG